VSDIISRGDREAFEKLFRSVSDYFEAFGQEAMNLSNTVMESLVAIP